MARGGPHGLRGSRHTSSAGRSLPRRPPPRSSSSVKPSDDSSDGSTMSGASPPTSSFPTMPACGTPQHRSPTIVGTAFGATSHLTTRPTLENELREVTSEEPLAEQLSLFSVISAVATDAVLPDDEAFDEPLTFEEDPSLTLELPPAPPLPKSSGAGSGSPVTEGPSITRTEVKAQLRLANAAIAQALVHQTGWSHAKGKRRAQSTRRFATGCRGNDISARESDPPWRSVVREPVGRFKTGVVYCGGGELEISQGAWSSAGISEPARAPNRPSTPSP